MGANFLNNYLYSGQEIADRGNVIVVTVGYRVGTLGFLSSGDSGLPGKLHTLYRAWYMLGCHLKNTSIKAVILLMS